VSAFATTDDVAARWRPLTADELVVAETLLGDASAIVRSQFPGIDGQITSGAVDPVNVRIVVAGMVKRALISPDEGVTQESQSVGPYSHSQSYANPLRNLFITDADRLLILGRAVSARSAYFTNDTTQCARSAWL
jgi:hypothetical protein